MTLKKSNKKRAVKRKLAASPESAEVHCSYTVQAAAKHAGISPHTVRTWELRYGITSPIRTDSGHRRYHREDVAKLAVIAALVRRGHQISAIARLPLADLRKLGPAETDDVGIDDFVSNEGGEANGPAGFGNSGPQLPAHILAHYKKLEHCIDSFDPAALAMGIKWMRTMLGVRTFILQIAIPLFRHIGKRVAAGAVDVGREHAFSAVLRDQIGDMLHTLQALSYYQDRHVESRTTVDLVFATPESDYHEFGILLGAALAASWGIPLCFAGANLPAKNLAETALAVEVKNIVLGNAAVPSAERRMSFKDYLLDLDDQLADGGRISIWVGGQGDRPLSKLPSGRSLAYLNSMEDLDVRLTGLARS